MTGPGGARECLLHSGGPEGHDAGVAAPSQALQTTDSHEGGAPLQGNHYKHSLYLSVELIV